jgi:beta-propeller uncharacterized protein DUF5122
MHCTVSSLGPLIIGMLVTLGCSGSGSGDPAGMSPPMSQPSSGFNGVVRSIMPVPDGSRDVYVAGDFTTYRGTITNRLVRLHADGTVAVPFEQGFDERVMALALAKDGSGALYAAGEFKNFDGQPAPRIARLKRDGSMDSGFRPGTGFNLNPLALAGTDDNTGDVYVAGNFTSFNGTAVHRIARLNADGSVDLAFAVGTGIESAPGINVGVRSVALAPDGSGRLYVGGSFVSYNGAPVSSLFRLQPDGMVDATFRAGSGIPASSAAPPVMVIMPALDGTRDFYVGGQIGSYDGQPIGPGVIRVHETGALDTTFASTLSLTVFAISPVPDGSGDIYIGGDTNSVPGSRLLRLNRNGSPVSNFQEAGGLDSSMVSIVSAADSTGDLYVGGLFTLYNGIAVNHLVRIHADGTVTAQ